MQNLQHCLDKDQEYFFVNVPTVVVIESNTEPSKELAIKSIQSATEEGTITMRTGWVPYIPLEERDRQVEQVQALGSLLCSVTIGEQLSETKRKNMLRSVSIALLISLNRRKMILKRVVLRST